MAIHWTKKDRATGETETYVTHEGCVLETFTRVERVMSDIYSDEYYARVFDIEKGTIETLKIGSAFELFCGPWGRAVVDVTPDIRDLMKARGELAAAQAKADRALERCRRLREKAEADWHRVEKDKVMVVVRGRKVPQGTVGKVFWLDDIHNPGRAGLAVSDERDENGRYADVVWVNADYLKNADEYPGYAATLAKDDEEEAA